MRAPLLPMLNGTRVHVFFDKLLGRAITHDSGEEELS